MPRVLIDRVCVFCGITFGARKYQIKMGNGNFCSHACSMSWRIKNDTRMYQHNVKSGSEHVRFIGDGLTSYERNREKILEKSRIYHAKKYNADPDKYRKRLREYRAKNVDKVREWSQTRTRRKGGRLKSGTVKKIGELQGWKCPVCHISIKNSYHVDHIIPLSKGGLHAADNIQILCPSCNCKKNAKDPILFMQEKGFLL